ncbi:MAG: hydrolase [Desulfosporosinus sp.]
MKNNRFTDECMEEEHLEDENLEEEYTSEEIGDCEEKKKPGCLKKVLALLVLLSFLAISIVFTIFYMPFNFGAVITRLTNKVQKAGADMPDWLCLSDHTSKWKMEMV